MYILVKSLYPSNIAGTLSIKEITEVLERISGLKSYYLILHDQDKKEDGTLKSPHYHLIVDYVEPSGKKSSLAIFEKQLQPFKVKCPNVSSEKVLNVNAQIRYLTHKDNPEKAPYKDFEVMTNNPSNYKILSTLQEKKLSENEKLMNMLNDLRSIANQKLEVKEHDLLEVIIANELLYKYFTNSDRFVSAVKSFGFRIIYEMRDGLNPQEYERVKAREDYSNLEEINSFIDEKVSK